MPNNNGQGEGKITATIGSKTFVEGREQQEKPEPKKPKNQKHKTVYFNTLYQEDGDLYEFVSQTVKRNFSGYVKALIYQDMMLKKSNQRQVTNPYEFTTMSSMEVAATADAVKPTSIPKEKPIIKPEPKPVIKPEPKPIVVKEEPEEVLERIDEEKVNDVVDDIPIVSSGDDIEEKTIEEQVDEAPETENKAKSSRAAAASKFFKKKK